MSFAKTEMQVVQWGEARGIIQNGNPVGQMVKLYEEVNELFDALLKGKVADDEARDAVGDIMVVLTMICGIKDFNMKDCYAGAYEQIKDRKGFLRPDGVFVKFTSQEQS